ncbi:hypothetical protein [Psychrobacter sp. ANT_WB68]|uniref:hypothetical protein n=1 Tax=Psychrobacter sp. ANT_WB68 TaxID=2597355 RepID=UPI0011F3703D|nr:hypothetical protein [Psychrobacter sp. ANT_WB68]KAA0914288.1 hypothetical protein FQ084_06865 [Psychrobacter sp. ANT_WB68]
MITNVIQKGSNIYIYNERGVVQAQIGLGMGERSGLKGFTAHSVSVQQGDTIWNYDEHGSLYGHGVYVGDGGLSSSNFSSNSSSEGGSIWVRLIGIIGFIAAYYFFFLK